MYVEWDRATRERWGLIAALINGLILLISCGVLFCVGVVRFGMASMSAIVMGLIGEAHINDGTAANHAWIFGVSSGVFVIYHLFSPVVVWDNSHAMRRWKWGVVALQLHMGVSMLLFIAALPLAGVAGGLMMQDMKARMKTAMLIEIHFNGSEESAPENALLVTSLSSLQHRTHVEFSCCGAQGVGGETRDNSRMYVFSCCRRRMIQDTCDIWSEEAHLMSDERRRATFYSLDCPTAIVKRFEPYAIFLTVAFTVIAFLKLCDMVVVQYLWTTVSYVVKFGASEKQKVPGYLFPYKGVPKKEKLPDNVLAILARKNDDEQQTP